MDLLSNFGGSMDNMDILQNIAMLSWMHNGDSAMAEKVLTARVGMEMYRRLSGEQEVDALRNQTILAIAKYVKDHPNAKKEDLQKVITKYIFDFASKLNQL